ncbi:hypothetical protein [Halobacillus sp. H74]|uniref:hypothetical protein n=1 Tax=Halobacillus sp. H74 TaxID=3457436 RepID=UPI003FCDBDEA
MLKHEATEELQTSELCNKEKARRFHDECPVVMPAGTARAEDPLGQVIFLTKSAEAVPATSIHRQAIREKQQQTLIASLN